MGCDSSDSKEKADLRGKPGEELRSLLLQAQGTDNYQLYQKLCRKRRKIPTPGPIDLRKIAILGCATTDFLEDPLKLELECLGIGTNIYQSDFNTYAHEMLNPESGAAAFRPDIAILLPTLSNITDWPSPGDEPEKVDAMVEQACQVWLGLCAAFHQETKCDVILGNFHLLPTRVMGNLGSRTAWDRNSFTRQLNAALGRMAPGYVHIFDVDSLSSYYGVNNWFDARFWHHAKQPVSFACMVPLIRNLAALIGSIYGKTAKCLVIDLDNTIWGGVVGDDGVAGLKIGAGDAEGEAFKSFQNFLLQLKSRGVLLAVSSKNDPANAKAPFEERSDMVLQLADFVSFKTSWDPKPESLVQIANELNIGLDSIVFVDDNPVERELMRQTLPQVRVVELSQDPTEYAHLVERTGWLELAQFTDEARRKTDQYKQNVVRQEMAAAHTDYQSFLASLEQRAVVQDFEIKDIDRVTQLINKTNQFNLTTRRMTRSELEEISTRTNSVITYIRLADRFGDDGIISILIARHEADTLHIDQWLMSCRVFKRGVEHLHANYLFEKAKQMGVQRVQGVYRPTAKNKIVEPLYEELGFACKSRDSDGTTSWSMDIADYTAFPVEISIVEELT